MKFPLKFWEDFWKWFLDQTPEMAKLYFGEGNSAQEYRDDFEELKTKFEKQWLEDYIKGEV